MRLKIIALAVCVLGAMIASAVAADITGTWVAEMSAPKMGPGGGPEGGGPGGGGPMKFTFEFKADGAKLGGNVLGPMGNKNEIIDGKIDGNNVSFAVKVDAMGNE